MRAKEGREGESKEERKGRQGEKEAKDSHMVDFLGGFLIALSKMRE
jgi:hypothetical protein